MNIDLSYEKAIGAGLLFLYSSQNSDGSFSAHSAVDTSDDKPDLLINSPTIFTTSLVLRALWLYKENFKHGEVCKDIVACGVSLLKNSQSASGTWNYWLGDSSFYTDLPYPDDLDDTALALQNIFFYTKESHPMYLAQFIKTLTQYEIQEGGPYGTWCIKTNNTASDDIWDDCDIVVNANITGALSRYDIILPNLVTYFDEKITQNDLRSSYYLSPITSLYFISAAYTGTLQEEIIALIKNLQHKDGHWNTPLYTALALTTLSRMRVDMKAYTDAITFLLETQHADGSWDPEPFFIERKTAEGTFLWKSAAWTTAAVLEALSTAQKPPTPSTPDAFFNKSIDHNRVLADLLNTIKKEHLLWHTYTQDFVNAIQSTPLGKDALLFPSIFYNALSPKGLISDDTISNDVLQSLGTAHLLGMIAYTLFDKILDGEISQSYLPYMNWCMRTFIDTYNTIGGAAFSSIVKTTLTTIEKAQQIEQTNRALLLSGTCTLQNLPNVENIPTYEKSIGYALPCAAILLLSNSTETLPHLWSFFQAFLTARQLHDDAHDVVDDLHHGILTIPVRLVLERVEPENPDAQFDIESIDTNTIQRIFWEEVFEVVSDRVSKELALARTALQNMQLANPAYFIALVETLEALNEKAITERAFMREFLTVY